MSEPDAEDKLAELVRNEAGGRCEYCGQSDDDASLSVYNVGDSDSVSLDSLAYLCQRCHRQQETGKKLTAEEVLEYLENHRLPFVMTSMLEEEYDVSKPTARERLTELVAAGDLERYERNSQQVFYFRPDYEAAEDVVSGLREHIDLSQLDPEAVREFARRPYKILPKSEDEYWIVVPRFLNFSVGHLHEQDEAYRTFVVNKFVDWFSDLPDKIAEEIDLHQRYESASVEGNLLRLSNRDEREQAWNDFDGQNGPFVQREGKDKIKIQQGKEFDVLAELISGGNLPFSPSRVNENDIRAAPPGVTLRDYQQRAWETFLEYSHIGVFWPMGCGKSFIGRYAGSRIKGEKLVVVPSKTLQEQWREDIDANCPDPDQWDVKTYQYLTHSNGSNLEEYQGADAPKMVIYDECHYIPANTFSKLALIDNDYTLGLSASPYREDDRSEYIFALTGYPVGIDWTELVEHGVVKYPDIHVYSYRTKRQKRKDLYTLVEQKPGNGLVFCDSRDAGEELADELGVPFINGDTPAGDRAKLIRDNRIAIASRVADEGLSVPELDWTIEHDFLGSSRRQEMQRAGRLLHQNSEESDDDGSDPVVDASESVHIVQMTDREIDKHGERLYSLEEKGFNISYHRRG